MRYYTKFAKSFIDFFVPAYYNLFDKPVFLWGDEMQKNMDIDLKRALFVLWSKIWVVILVAAVLGVAGYSYAHFFTTPMYSSSIKIYVNNHNSESQIFSTSQLQAAQNLADTYMVILKSRSVLDKVSEQTALGYSTSALSRMITAHSINGTEVFEVVVTTTDYKHSATIANAVADVLPGKMSEVAVGSSVRIVDYANENPTPVNSSDKKYTTLGAAIGVLLSAGAIVLSDIMDTTITSEDYLTHTYYKYPLLAVIPDANETKSNYYRGYHRGYYRGYYQTMPKKIGNNANGGADR